MVHTVRCRNIRFQDVRCLKKVAESGKKLHGKQVELFVVVCALIGISPSLAFVNHPVNGGGGEESWGWF